MLALAFNDIDHCVENDLPSESQVQKELKRSECNDHKARAVIAISLFDENLMHVKHTQSAK